MADEATSRVHVADCVLCQKVSASEPPPGGWVYEDDVVLASVLESAAIPGWLALQTKQHLHGLAGLGPDVSAAVGRAAGLVAEAMAETNGGARVYMYSMCQRIVHFHLLLGTPPAVGANEPLGGPLLSRILLRDPQLLDLDAAIARAESLRQWIANRDHPGAIRDVRHETARL